MDPSIRIATPADYEVLAPLIDDWWSGPILGSLPKLFKSADFHQAMGFAVTGPAAGYNGPGHDMLVFERTM